MVRSGVTATDVLVRTDRHVSAPLGDEVAMLDIERGSYYVLDDVATFVWELLRTPTSVAALLNGLRERYAVEPARCEADVLPFLGELLDRGLVRRAGDAP